MLQKIILTCICCISVFSCSAQENVISPEKFVQRIKSDTTAVVIDVRQPGEFMKGHLPGAILMNVLDSAMFDNGLRALRSDRTYYIYCRSGRRSQKAAQKMKQQGLRVVDMKGGYEALRKSELTIPLVIEPQ